MPTISVKDLSEKTGINQKTIRKILKKEGFRVMKTEGRTHFYDNYAIDCLQYYKKFKRNRKTPTNKIHVLPDKTDAQKDHASVNVPCFASCECAQQIHVLRTELEQCKKVIKLIVAKIQKS